MVDQPRVGHSHEAWKKLAILLASAFVYTHAACIDTAQTHSRSRDASSTTEKGALSLGPLHFEPASSLDLLTVTSRIERAMYFALGQEPPVVILEILSGYSTTGKYSLASKYATLEDLAADLEAQEPKYDWDVVNGKLLVIKPASGAILDVGVADFSAKDLKPCEVFQQLNRLVFPGRPGKGGCITRNAPRFRSGRSAYAIGTNTVTLNVSGSHTVQDVVLELISNLQGPVGVTVFEIDTRLQPAWEVRW